MDGQKVNFTKKDLFLLVLLTLCWGLNWPIMKLGITNFPPLTFRAIAMFGGVLVIGGFAYYQGISLKITKKQFIPLLLLMVPNAFLCQSFMILGVKLLSGGRAAILCYTMPVWTVFFGFLLFRNKLSLSAWGGVACALAGAFLLLSNEFSALTGQPFGAIFELIAAAAWGLGTVLIRNTKLDLPIVTITFWMFALSIPFMFTLALFLEYRQLHFPDFTELLAIAYNFLLVFGFAQIVWFRLARSLPPVASSLSLMMAPVVGVFSSAIALKEILIWRDYVAVILILLSMIAVLFNPKRASKNE